ncbi:probable CCR4-associated factor 1 homolog 11 [Trifolium pratense]|uniref:probable CCR4-associated factor 1 homolog 11 n=1 Tax=Trifolium pratense TaxID=57577 RepID=UPI001E697DA6|nr:probable CCR4-associated factor 1 homolog 11 [Trifolium pratense]
MKEDRSSKSIIIREVWANNLEDEFNLIRQLIGNGKYNFISMDTEFPGFIYSPKVDYLHLKPSDNYDCMKANVDALKLVQLGLTLSDASGNLPDLGTNNRYIWQFNFRDFDVERDLHDRKSIDMLHRQGFDFKRNVSHGVDSFCFSELMLRSGLVFNSSITWVTFHSTYDFGYLVKILRRSHLPTSLEKFLSNVRELFGSNVYDMKYIMQYTNALVGGLEGIANTLHVNRVVGKAHQAGSDSLLTWQTFQKMVKTYFPNNEVQKYAGVIFGLEVASCLEVDISGSRCPAVVNHKVTCCFRSHPSISDRSVHIASIQNQSKSI